MELGLPDSYVMAVKEALNPEYCSVNAANITSIEFPTEYTGEVTD